MANHTESDLDAAPVAGPRAAHDASDCLGADVAILPAGSRHEALPWLARLACYLIVSMRDDGAAVAVIAAG